MTDVPGRMTDLTALYKIGHRAVGQPVRMHAVHGMANEFVAAWALTKSSIGRGELLAIMSAAS